MSLNFSRPTFIVGCTNTGTKILQSFMAKVLPINNFPLEPHYLGFAPNLLGRLNRLFALHPCFVSSRLDPNTHPGSIESGPVSRDSFIQHISLYAQHKAKEMFDSPAPLSYPILFKEPKFILRIPWLLDIFPDCKIIITVRNPWSTIEGIRRRMHSFGDLPFACDIPTCASQYSICYTQAILDTRLYPLEKFFFCRFEDFCTSPMDTLNKIASFLGLPLNIIPEIYLKTIDSKLIDDSFKRLSLHDIKFIDEYTHSLQKRFNYSINIEDDSKLNFSF